MSRTVLTGATIIDGVSAESFVGEIEYDDNGTIVDVRRALVGNGGSKSRDTEARTLDCSGLFIIPGLIDSHCHLIYTEARDLQEMELMKSLSEASIDAVANAAMLLRLGFTTIRDLGSRGNIGVICREAIARGRISGPRVLAAGQIITTVGGLLDGHPSHLFSRSPYQAGHGETVTGPWEARDAVRRQVKDGVDWIKTETSGSGFNPSCPADRDTVTEVELTAIVDEAHRKGRPVAVHAESTNGILLAAKAGVQTIEHGVFMTQEALDLMLQNDIAYSPTLALYTGLADWGGDVGIPKDIVELHKSTRPDHISSVQRAYAQGALIIAGSDAGVPGFPQGAGTREVQAYVDLVGMTHMEALQTLTSQPAKVFGLEDSIGSLLPGRRADMVVFREDPSRDIGVLQSDVARVAVVQGGELVAGALPQAGQIGATDGGPDLT
jgi:imidazolonepropionase-like amidohydrolase